MNKNFTKGRLVKAPYALLPTGAVKPDGWLRDQLSLQADGVLLDMEKYPDYSEKSAWRGGNGENWEDGPYYFRGLVALAYTLNSAELIDRAKVWIESVLSSQTDDGMFGPASNDDWWPRMPVLMALRDYYEATELAGEPDERIIPFMERYFRYQLTKLPKKPLASWAQARGGDNIDSVLWLYNRLYREDAPQDTDWLLELGKLLRAQTTDWVRLMHETTVRTHVVNTSQAMKTPPLYYLMSGDSDDRSALRQGLRHIAIDHGRIDGLPNSDEAARDNQSTRGSELCGIVEGILSTEIAFSILGEAYLCDRLETLAYNALPAAYAPDYSGHVYYILQNQVLATTGYHEFDCDHGDSSAFGAPCGFDCCFANNHMGWSKFVRSMWMSYRPDVDCPDVEGLAVVAYGPCFVEAELGDGVVARFDELTDYPFSDTITLVYHGDKAEFPLSLPIPAWCDSPSFELDGKIHTPDPVTGRFFRFSRLWKDGDSVRITLPMQIKFSEWYNRSVALTRGPLIYSLGIDEEWSSYSDNSTRELKVAPFGCVKNQEVYPKSRWNYALLPDADRMKVETRPIGRQPFTQGSAPIVIKAKGQIVPEWRLDGNKAAAQPLGGVVLDESALCDIDLVPYGAARLKITHFPRLCENVGRIYRDDPQVSMLAGECVSEFVNITLPKSSGCSLDIYPETGSKYKLFLNGTQVNVVENHVERLEDFSEFCTFGYYNTLTFIGDRIKAVELTPKGALTKPEIPEIEAASASLTLHTNVTRRDYSYEVDLGTDSSSLNRHFRGFKSDRALITGLKPATDYYVRINSMIGGRRVRSEVYHTKTLPVRQYEPIFPTFSGDFSSERWKELADGGISTVDCGKIDVRKTYDYKRILDGGERWNEYAAAATITLHEGGGNAGLVFNITDADRGANSYRGYYFGIGTGMAVIGSANGEWNELASVGFDIEEGIPYRLTVKVSDGRIKCYIDGTPIFALYDGLHKLGSVGLRCYNVAFEAKDPTVMPLDADDISELEAIEKPEIKKLEIDARVAFELIQVKFGKIAGADSYRIDYGTSSGFYQNTITDIKFNPYKGSSPFGADKTAFTFTGTTCYLRMSAWSGDVMLTQSDEIKVERNIEE